MEIQREDKRADPHRIRFHSRVLDIENLNTGQEFHELPDTFTIFMEAVNRFKGHCPLKNRTMRKTIFLTM